jgi:hypothetical protein
MRIAPRLALLVTMALAACVGPTPSDVWATPDDVWTWQVDRNYQRFAHCLAHTLNTAPIYSWFFQAPRPVTNFDQPWRYDKIVLKSIDPFGVTQVSIQIAPATERTTQVIASAKNLAAFGGGSPMYYVQGSVEYCARV